MDDDKHRWTRLHVLQLVALACCVNRHVLISACVVGTAESEVHAAQEIAARREPRLKARKKATAAV